MMARWLIVCLILVCGGVPAGAQDAVSPNSFDAIAASTSEIRCYWLPAPGATGYQLQRDGQTIATLPATATDYADTGLAPDSTHRYALRTLAGDATSSAKFYTERTFAPFPTLAGEETHRGRKALPVVRYDVVIVQASSGGVAAAIEAGRRGLKVALIESTTRLGGMPVNGLSATDLRRPEHASGFLVRFAARVRQLYAAAGDPKATGLAYEPRVAQQAMKSLLYEAPNVTVFRRARLAAVHARVLPDGTRRRVESIEVEALGPQGEPTGKRAEFRASVFIDSTDCGDLAAWAGAPFRYGREHRTKGEPHNGVIYYDRDNNKLLSGSTGVGDKRIQSYGYLLIVKDYGSGVDKTIPKPPGYRKEDFIHSPAWQASWAVTSGKLPLNKYELNQHPEGGDLQEINYSYPNANYKTRARIEKLYHDHVLAYLYYLQTTPSHYCVDCKKWLSEAEYEAHDKSHQIKTTPGQKQLGLPDDEYRDTGGFPPLLYVREGRRIVGEQTPIEEDITDARKIVRPESVGLGDYPMDSHAVRPKTDWDRPDMGEGEWWLFRQTPWHELPLGILIPQRLDNVFVTTAVSSTHVSFGTYRLEPVRMAFGEAAAAAADLCIRYHLAAREVPARQAQAQLLPTALNTLGDPNLFLYFYTDMRPAPRHYRAIQYMTTRGLRVEGEKFLPDAPTTYAEFVRWVTQLTERAAPPPQSVREGNSEWIRRAFFPYMGASADPSALKSLAQQKDSTQPVTRAEVADWLARVFPSLFDRQPASPPYMDLPDSAPRRAIDALAAYGIDSRLWDGMDAELPGGKLRFQPDAPLRHADMFLTLYFVNLSLGPLFNDNPVDGRNGRAVPPALFETVAAPLPKP